VNKEVAQEVVSMIEADPKLLKLQLDSPVSATLGLSQGYVLPGNKTPLFSPLKVSLKNSSKLLLIFNVPDRWHEGSPGHDWFHLTVDGIEVGKMVAGGEVDNERNPATLSVLLETTKGEHTVNVTWLTTAGTGKLGAIGKPTLIAIPIWM